MTQKPLIFQSLWAMERRHTDGFERTLDENIATDRWAEALALRQMVRELWDAQERL